MRNRHAAVRDLHVRTWGRLTRNALSRGTHLATLPRLESAGRAPRERRHRMKTHVMVPLLATLALALTALPAVADCTHGHGKRMSFEELDKDQSGTLTLDEFTAAAQARATERFNKLDANKDGVVTPDEM